VSDTPASDDPTLAFWRAEQEAKDRAKAAQQARQGRTTDLERAFLDVRNGMPKAGNNEQAALAFVARWRHLAHLIENSPDLVHRRLDQIKAEPHSTEAYALRFISTARTNEADAVKLLLNSWQASKEAHSEVLYWLTSGLETEIMGKNTETQSSPPVHKQDTSAVEQASPALIGEGPPDSIPVERGEAGESVEWTTADSPSRWAKLFDISPPTFMRRLKEGKIRHKKLSTKSYLIAIADLPAMHQAKFRNVDKPSFK